MKATCLIPNCRKRAPSDDAFCAEHRRRHRGGLPYVLGVGRSLDDPLTLTVHCSGRPTDNELRAVHEKLTEWK